MRVRCWSLVLLLALVGVACGDVEPPQTGSTSEPLEAMGDDGRREPPMLGAHEPRGAGPPRSSALMTWHNGAIMTSAAVTAIFWGTSWSSTSFAADKLTGLDTFYEAYGGSNYAGASTEYTGTNGTVGTAVTSNPHVVDLSAAPIRAPRVSAIQAEVCKVIPAPVANGYYPVYTDARRGSAGYCAWHSYGSCNGVPVQFGFFFNLDGDPGCDPQDSRGVHSQGLSALANVSAHELSEAMTDPSNGGWYDSSGAENGDKCAWTFNVPYVMFKDGSTWKVQGEWSNAAFSIGTGYPNRNGQRGCLSGQ